MNTPPTHTLTESIRPYYGQGDLQLSFIQTTIKTRTGEVARGTKSLGRELPTNHFTPISGEGHLEALSKKTPPIPVEMGAAPGHGRLIRASAKPALPAKNDTRLTKDRLVQHTEMVGTGGAGVGSD